MSATAISDHDVLAIDIGGTKIALAVVASGRVTQRRQIATPRSGLGSDIVEAIAEQAALLPPTDAAGIATLIWDIAKRYESPSEPKIGDRQPPR